MVLSNDFMCGIVGRDTSISEKYLDEVIVPHSLSAVTLHSLHDRLIGEQFEFAGKLGPTKKLPFTLFSLEARTGQIEW